MPASGGGNSYGLVAGGHQITAKFERSTERSQFGKDCVAGFAIHPYLSGQNSGTAEASLKDRAIKKMVILITRSDLLRLDVGNIYSYFADGLKVRR